jgi:hypothetical protein
MLKRGFIDNFSRSAISNVIDPVAYAKRYRMMINYAEMYYMHENEYQSTIALQIPDQE